MGSTRPSEPDAAPDRPRRRFKLTFPGKVLVIFAVVGTLPAIALGGVVALLPPLAAALLAAGALGSWSNLRRVRPLAPEPKRAFAGEPFELELRLRNLSSLFRTRDLVLQHGDRRRSLPRTAGFAPSIEPGTERGLVVRYRMPDRGRHPIYKLTISSTFPLGLIERSVEWSLPVDFLALPRLGSVRNFEQRLPPFRGVQAESRLTLAGSEEFYGLRQWREGESQHLVHWKISARQGKVVVRELRGEERPPIHLTLSLRLTGTGGGRRRVVFEEAVSLAATLADHMLRQRYRLRFSIEGPEPWSTECSQGRRSLFSLLTRLALVEPVASAASGSEPADGTSTAPRLASARRGEIGVRVVCAGGGPDATEASDGRTLVLDVDDRSIEELFHRARPNEMEVPVATA